MIPGSANPLLLRTAAAGGYSISRSIRLNAPDSAYLSRTPASAGNRKTWTWAGWVKRSKLGTNQALIHCRVSSSSDDTSIAFTTSDTLRVVTGTSDAVVTNAVFRDVSAWYHIICAFDTTQATAANRIKLYVNGVEQTYSATSYPTQNSDWSINSTSEHNIGRYNINVFLADFYLADCYLIDSQALTPSSFAETDATTGVWVPKAYSGTYGTNGFHLEFADNSAATAAALGKDTSGNGLNWTPNNLSVSAGAGNDSLVDVPTNGSQTDTGVGGEVRGNYCTWNPLDKSGSPTYSNGNLDAFTGASGYGTTRGTIAVSSGKWYWECTFNSTDASNDCYFGILDITGSLVDNLGGNAKGYAYWAFNGNKVNNGSSSAYGSSYAPGDVIGAALNLDAGSITFYKNGVSQGTAFSSLSGTFAPAFSDSGGSSIGLTGNFGQRPFAYTAPSGFKALCSANLPAPVVTKPSTFFDVALWTGNGSSGRAITGLNMSPDFVWIKQRSSAATDHVLFDTVRGATKALLSDATLAELTNAQFLQSFDSTGFTVGSDQNVNNNTGSFVGWAWDAGSSTVTNNSGSITGASVRANTSAGFSIVTYTGNGTSGATVGHGLGVAPSLIIVKTRSTANSWLVYAKPVGATKYLLLNSTTAATTYSGAWFDTEPTSTVFTLGNDSGVNQNTTTYVAYCFAPVAGLSSFGSYVGNGSTDGPFVFCNFRPRWLMIKRSDSASVTYGWFILDTARNTYNVMNTWLAADNSAADGADAICDALSNGFKVRTTAGNINTSSGTFVYAAFAEAPFNYSRAR